MHQIASNVKFFRGPPRELILLAPLSRAGKPDIDGEKYYVNLNFYP